MENNIQYTKYVKFDKYPKYALIVLMVVVVEIGLTVAVPWVTAAFRQRDLSNILPILITTAVVVVLLRLLRKGMVKIDKLYYLKIGEKHFEYLALPEVSYPTKAAFFNNANFLYVDPYYNQKQFNNIQSFEQKGRDQIVMKLDNGRYLRIRLRFYPSKLRESLSALNEQLARYKEAKASSEED